MRYTLLPYHMRPLPEWAVKMSECDPGATPVFDREGEGGFSCICVAPDRAAARRISDALNMTHERYYTKGR